MNIAIKIAGEAGVKVTTADLKTLNIPDYDQDVQDAGFPEPVKQLAEMVKNADVFLIASPEYNYSVPGVLKNAIDWVSRVKPNPFGGKTAALFGASTGQFGTVRGQFQIRQIFLTLNVIALPQPQVLIADADNAFEPDGSLKNKTSMDSLRLLLQKTFELAEKMK